MLNNNHYQVRCTATNQILSEFNGRFDLDLFLKDLTPGSYQVYNVKIEPIFYRPTWFVPQTNQPNKLSQPIAYTNYDRK